MYTVTSREEKCAHSAQTSYQEEAGGCLEGRQGKFSKGEDI